MTTTASTATESTMPEPLTVPPFAVISGAQVRDALQGRERQIVELVETTYRLYGAASLRTRRGGSDSCANSG